MYIEINHKMAISGFVREKQKVKREYGERLDISHKNKYNKNVIYKQNIFIIV